LINLVTREHKKNQKYNENDMWRQPGVMEYIAILLGFLLSQWRRH